MDSDLPEAADIISWTSLLSAEALNVGPRCGGCECFGGYVMGGAEISNQDNIYINVNGVVLIQAQEFEDPWSLGG